MKTLSITFSLTLDVACPDHLDADWVARQFHSRSDRFTTLHIDGDPDAVVVTAAYSGLEGSKVTRQVSAPDGPAYWSMANPAMVYGGWLLPAHAIPLPQAGEGEGEV